MTYNELLHYTKKLEIQLFWQKESGHLIMQKCNKKCFLPTERVQIKKDIYDTFGRLITIFERSCSSLTTEDKMFCCLTYLGLDNLVISHCLGGICTKATNQRKYRVKKKMKEERCDLLFEEIFG
jgi:hypothetical protein